jgi:hypothetical protein
MWGSKDGGKKQVKPNQVKQEQLPASPAATHAATDAPLWASRLRSMRHPRSNTRRLRDSCHAGLCGVAMAFDHVMIVQLV